MKRKFTAVIVWFMSLRLAGKASIIVLTAILVSGIFWQLLRNKSQVPVYQTAVAEKGALVVSVTASGRVAATNITGVNTQVTGVVRRIFVADGNTVSAGQQLVEISPDLASQQAAAQARAAYQSAKNSLESAKVSYYTLQSDLLTKWKIYKALAESSAYQNSDGSPRATERTLPEFVVAQNDWLTAEAKYKNQTAVVSQSQSAYNSAWLSYKLSSPVVVAPVSGKISGLSVQAGSLISSGGGGTDTSIASGGQKIANIISDALPQVTVNLTEIDVPRVAVGQKATITLDAFADKTFTGKVISVDTSGAVSSGVTSYPAVIVLDTDPGNIYPNMSAQVAIITQAKNGVLLVPVSSVQHSAGDSSVRVMRRGGSIESVAVTVGLASDTQVEIVSGLSAGDVVITGQTTDGTARNSSQSVSPFSPFGAGRGNFGGAGVRVAR